MNALVLELHFKQPRKAERGSRTSSCLTRYFHLLPVGEFMTKPLIMEKHVKRVCIDVMGYLTLVKFSFVS